MPISLKLAWAGTWPLIQDWGWPLLAIAAILAVEFFSAQIGASIPPLEPILKRFQKDLLWVAAIIAVALAWGAKMQHDEKLRCEARQAVVNIEVSKAVTKAKKSPGLDRWDISR